MNTLFLLKQRVNYVKTENTIKYKFKKKKKKVTII